MYFNKSRTYTYKIASYRVLQQNTDGDISILEKEHQITINLKAVNPYISPQDAVQMQYYYYLYQQKLINENEARH